METGAVRRLSFIDPVDLDHFEGYLDHMARKGLFFHRFGPTFTTFRRGTPAPMRYRLEPYGNLWRRESQNYCRELGWTSLGRVGKYFELYCNPDPTAPELHTDPVVRAYSLDATARILKRYCAVLLILTLVFLAVVLLPYLFFHWPVLTLVESPLAGNLLPAIMELISLSLSIRAYAAFFRFCRRLRRGKEPHPEGSWRRSARLYLGILLTSVALTAVCIVQLWAFVALPWEGEIAGQERPFPLLSLAELEQSDTLEVRPSLDFLGDGLDRDNYVRFSWSPLAPEQYETDQHMALPGSDKTVSLSMRWYRLSLPFLASPLLEELVYRYTEYNYFPGEYTVSEAALPGFDRAVLAVDNDFPGQRLFLRRGGTVAYLSYSGEADLLARPELLEHLFDFQD
ncbi:DUF2812 domain-containing protein [Lawsonibacter celer]|uniref:DUF2812 domain-containing protein n=1 Tax=Lawsonibacter celer TaxID=2986526 RepID=UPI0016494808|nr:DUF2812 domain-containing protein [Lawsonibacter celer]